MPRRAVMTLVACILALTAAGAQLPAPSGPVNDFAELLSPAQEQTLVDLVTAVERDTTAEIAVATIPSLDGTSVEEYANRLFAEWGIGQRGKDNGVLILVAPNEREMRIEVGYGLEGVLPDGLAGAIIRETFLPAFRDDDYARGIIDGTGRVADVVRRNETLTAEQRAALDEAEAQSGQSYFVAAFLSLFVGLGAFLGGTAAGARVLAQMFFGALFAGMALFMALLAAPLPGFLALVLLFIVLAVLGYRLGQRPGWRKNLRGTGKGGGGTGWVIGGGGAGSSRGGSSSGSFGGGRSGGGGASGRW